MTGTPGAVQSGRTLATCSERKYRSVVPTRPSGGWSEGRGGGEGLRFKEPFLELLVTPLTDLPLSSFPGSNITAAFLTQRQSEPQGPLVRTGGAVWGDQPLGLTPLQLLGERSHVLWRVGVSPGFSWL